MDRTRLLRLIVAVAGALAAAVVLFVLLVMLNGGWGFVGCTGTAAFGWTLPLVVGGLIGGVAWTLLFAAPNYTDDGEMRRSVPCPSCGKAVMEDWRLCPYCGRILPADVAVEHQA